MNGDTPGNYGPTMGNQETVKSSSWIQVSVPGAVKPA
jgi:hypothetical protein